MYVADDEIAVGVPDISPVEVLNVNPAGSCGAIDQNVAAPPLAVGVVGVIAVPLVKMNGLPL